MIKEREIENKKTEIKKEKSEVPAELEKYEVTPEELLEMREKAERHKKISKEIEEFLKNKNYEVSDQEIADKLNSMDFGIGDLFDVASETLWYDYDFPESLEAEEMDKPEKKSEKDEKRHEAFKKIYDHSYASLKRNERIEEEERKRMLEE